MDKYYRVGEKVNGYSIKKYIGDGRFGIAYLAVNDKYEKCVIKQLKNEMLEQSRNKLFYEEQILRRLDDPRFPKFISKFKDEYREGYILEYIEGHVIYDLLRSGRYRFDRDTIYRIGSKLLEIAELLHSHDIVHRDIRPPNVILKDNNDLALIDFGLARFIDNVRYIKQTDYWYIGDFLLFLYYSTYRNIKPFESPWYDELDLSYEERKLLKKLLGIEGRYYNIEEIKIQFDKIKNRY